MGFFLSRTKQVFKLAAFRDFSYFIVNATGVIRPLLLRCAVLSGYLKIVERKIKEALERGEFDNLPGKGKPLDLGDDSQVPEDLRIAYRILKNADCLPPEIQEKKEILQMEDMLASIPDERERYKLVKKINYRIMKLNMSRAKSPLLEEKQLYYKKLVDKIAEK